MLKNPTTSPLRRTLSSSYRPIPMNWREKGVGISRILFGLVWVIAALLKWQPQFQNTFVDQVSAVQDGQPTPIQAWIAFPYALLFVLLLFLSAGRYYGLDAWLTPRLGQLGFLASGSLRRNRK